MHKKIVALDIDGTIAKYEKWEGIHNIGEVLEGAVRLCETLLAEGYEVIIFSTRLSMEINKDHDEIELYGAVKDWLSENKFPDKVAIWTGHGKPPFNLLIDDRCYCHSGNTEFTDTEINDILKILDSG